MSQGYQIIATGHQKYLEMAENCIRSLKLFDPSRPIQLVTDLSVSRKLLNLCDYITPYRLSEYSGGPLVKLEMLDYAIFDETIFVDADCLMLNSGINPYFDSLSSNHSVACPGEWKSSGSWYGMSIANICSAASVKRLLRINSGALFFKKDEASNKFFLTAKSLYAELGNISGKLHKSLTASDEIYLAIAFEKCRLSSFPISSDEGLALMISTLNSTGFEVDVPAGRASFVKRGKKLAPILFHFIGLRPENVYYSCAKMISSELRAIA
jgi:hypothetical protein